MNDPLDARDALAIAHDAKARLAATPTPPWYAPLYGLGCGAMVLAVTLRSPASIVIGSVALAGVVSLYRLESHRSGVRLNGFRAGATLPISIALLVALLGAVVIALRLRDVPGYGWAPIAAGAVSAVAAALASLAWDRVWRRETAAKR